MATATEYLGLTKPAEEEYVSVDVINENMEKLDLEARSARPVKKGGTGKTSWAANRIIYASAAEVLAQMAFPTTAGSFLCQGTSGVPYWSTPAQVLAAIGALGSYGTTTQNVDLNTMTTQGAYTIYGDSCTNLPPSISASHVQWGLLLVLKSGSTIVQMVFPANTIAFGAYVGGMYWRALFSTGSWTDWKEAGDFKADGSIVMTGALSTSSDGTGIGTYAGNTAGAFIECFKGD
ncbi:MAG: hypothetical protein J6A81_09375 [Peptococcaceae bacterium]|nr:hypothetical protein [Peptococcaceae bacterium]